MDRARFQAITREYSRLRIAVVGDYSLDRYLEIDPRKRETSIETGREVHNVVEVRGQPGAAGTILNNLVALGVGRLYPVGFAGEDGEGYELLKALQSGPRVDLNYFIQTPLRRTFAYTKPLLCQAGRPPEELNRLDFKNWTRTPEILQGRMMRALRELAAKVDALLFLEQVEIKESGVITPKLLDLVAELRKSHPRLLMLADSRRGLTGYPSMVYKMNRSELAYLLEEKQPAALDEVRLFASNLASRTQCPVIVTLAEEGILGAAPGELPVHLPAFPLRGPIDIVGAGDAVTANLAAALCAGASLSEALELANAAASVVIHQIGTTGTASPEDLQSLLVHPAPPAGSPARTRRATRKRK